MTSIGQNRSQAMMSEKAIDYIYGLGKTQYEDLSYNEKIMLLYLLAPGKELLDLIDETQYLMEDLDTKQYDLIQYYIASEFRKDPRIQEKLDTILFPDAEMIFDYIKPEPSND